MACGLRMGALKGLTSIMRGKDYAESLPSPLLTLAWDICCEGPFWALWRLSSLPGPHPLSVPDVTTTEVPRHGPVSPVGRLG